ncbi:LysR family transcriptional regulator [Gilvimarinus sp. SDUM040013]|uniref:LysR family transcriptional regulator n=1 Tax=Gilvimarinus gilvus TaxID=3058038 RepID=A0ABU4RY74_9GAMM|nr:LysR family transcriptional regulator [Gilvimarinus sp. SDUM040013]MDO3386182.1 LysR family transcriptional regulator [Gilvimarinus sp. SDUM040013]MDX6849823.1 LysR family transcriptional regulator [Gilvimarinus sp. SDUM040013]
MNHHLFTHLPFLAALYRHHSFTKAAQSLHVSQTAVTYQIKQLETKLGSTLVLRQSGSQLRFTADGESLVRQYLDCEKRLNLAIEGLSHGKNRGTLRLSTPVDFGSLIAPNLVKSLRKLAPELKVELHSSDSNVDLMHDHWDIAIRSRIGTAPSGLFASPMCLLASLEYIKQQGAPAGLSQLHRHTILLRQGSALRSWQQLLGAPPEFAHRLTFGDVLGMREAALAGLGIALLPEFVARREIQRGELIKLLPKQCQALTVQFDITRIDTPQTEHYEGLIRQAFQTIGQ